MYRDQEQRDFARQLRNQPTEPEKRLWWFLRAEKIGVKFRRQAAIGPYVTDFACFSHKLIVELDGPQHLQQHAQIHDARRTAWLASNGFRVIRFRNQEVDENVHSVVDAIRRAVREIEAVPDAAPLPSPPHEGEGAGQGRN